MIALVALAVLFSVAVVMGLSAWQYRNLLKDAEEARGEVAKDYRRYRADHECPFEFPRRVR